MKSQNVHFQVLESYYFQTSIKNLEYLAHIKEYFSKKNNKTDFKENEC